MSGLFVFGMGLSTGGRHHRGKAARAQISIFLDFPRFSQESVLPARVERNCWSQYEVFALTRSRLVGR
jgi:hypothetical protein